MTKHRSREDRIEEILAAAVEEVVTNGYPNLTMDAVTDRTTLSKGGVYRYFANKQDLALRLFEMALQRYVDFSEQEVLAWRLPLKQTLCKLLARERTEEEQRWLHVLFQLLPETLYREPFREVQVQAEKQFMVQYQKLIQLVVVRDCLIRKPDFDERLVLGARLGRTLMEGMNYQAIRGVARQDHEEQLHRFIEIMINDLI